MDYVAKKKLIKDDSRVNLLGNQIVLVAAKDKEPSRSRSSRVWTSQVSSATGAWRSASRNRSRRGKYGKAALEKLGIWSSVEERRSPALKACAPRSRWFSRGEAPYGIVYQTDVSADPGVAIVGTFPEDSHPPIIYPIAITASSTNPDAQAYFDYLKSAKAVPFFEHEGFTVLEAVSTTALDRRHCCFDFDELAGPRRARQLIFARPDLDALGLSSDEWTAIELSLRVSTVAMLVEPALRHSRRNVACAR